MKHPGTYIVTQKAKSPHLNSIFAVFEAVSKAEALRMFADKGFGVRRDSAAGKQWNQPVAEELEWGVEYTL